jgi:aspartate kinase
MDSITIYVAEEEATRTETLLHETVVENESLSSVTLDEGIAVVRVTGGALPNQPGMVRGIVDPLADAHLSVHDVITSATSVAIFVDWSDRERALEIIQQEF